MRTVSFLALWLCVTHAASQSAQSCLADVDGCLPEFRNRYLDIDHFWFGTPYTTLCPGLPYCVNVSPQLQSVMSRILYSSDTVSQQTAVANIQILNVTFEQPARKYYACDTWFQVPATPPVQVNPLGPTMISQLTAQSMPHVTWTPRTPQSLYTVVMVDLSYVYLHAFYINCMNGTMENGEAVRPWLGTSVSYLINNPYTFVVYEQVNTIPSQTAQQAMQETSAEGRGIAVLNLFQVNVLVQKLSAYLNPDIQFSVIMEVYPDPFGSSQMTNFRVVADQCPLFYSQLPTFHSAVRGMQIPDPKWSPPAFSLSQVSTDAQLTSLTVRLEVTYYTDDFTDTACCRKFSLTRGSYKISPLDSRPVTTAMTRHAPRVFLSPLFLSVPAGGGRGFISGRIYTLLMVDVTPALASTAAGPELTVRWLVTNIVASDFETGTEVAPYSAPCPEQKDDAHTYMFLLFVQSSVVDPSTLQPYCPNGFYKCKLRVTDLIQAWSLGDVVSVNWFQGQFDGYALKKLYTSTDQSEQQVCRGRRGYAYPCQAAMSDQRCSAIGQFSFGSRVLIGCLTAFIFLLNQCKSF